MAQAFSIRSSFVALLVTWALSYAPSAFAVEFAYDGGVFVVNALSRVTIADEFPDAVVETQVVVEKVGDVTNIYCRMTANAGTTSVRAGCGADVGPLVVPQKFTLNYYRSIRLPGTDFPSYELRKTELVRVLAQDETRELIEYYHAGFDHYFMTSDAIEQGALDSGYFSGWTRTGGRSLSFVPAEPVSALAPSCRYYGLPSAGLDTHFYSSNPAECAYVAAKWPEKWVLESNEAFFVVKSVGAGGCPPETVAVRRFFNGGYDVNHRYVTNAQLEFMMTQKGWIPEEQVWCTQVLSQPNF